MPTIPKSLDGVSVRLKANIYFDGGVVSHVVTASDGTRRTVGLIRPGSYRFDTDAPERMDIISGACSVKRAGAEAWTSYAAGASFEIPAKSSFDIRVDAGLLEYLCTYS